MNDISNLHCDFELECSNPIFPLNTLVYDAVLPTKIWLQKDQQLEDRVEIVLFFFFFIMSVLTVTLTLKTVI